MHRDSWGTSRDVSQNRKQDGSTIAYRVSPLSRDAARWDLDHKDAAGLENSKKLGKVLQRERPLEMLQHDSRNDDLEGSTVEKSQVVGAVDKKTAAIGIFVEGARLLDHRSGDIHSHNVVEVLTESLGEPADAAPEIERLSAGRKCATLDESLSDERNVVAAGCKELFDAPTGIALFIAAKDCPQCVSIRQIIPVPLLRIETQGEPTLLKRIGSIPARRVSEPRNRVGVSS
jgi:hypothetical protein